MHRVLLFSLATVALSAQMMPGPGGIRSSVSPALRQYLELTDEQVNRIDRLNNALRQFEAEKARRSVQVRAEIGQETARPSLDPMSLGLRYVEMEAIRREIEAERKETSEAVQAVLTPAQRTRTMALQEVLRNVGLACDAVNNNLITMPPTPVLTITPVIPPGQTGSFASFLLGGTPACPGIPAVRRGDFASFLPAQP